MNTATIDRIRPLMAWGAVRQDWHRERAAVSGGSAGDVVARILGAIREQDGGRVPGDNRGAKRQAAARDGVEVSTATVDRIRALMA